MFALIRTDCGQHGECWRQWANQDTIPGDGTVFWDKERLAREAEKTRQNTDLHWHAPFFACYNRAMRASLRTRAAIMSFVMLGFFLGLPVAHAQKVSPPNVPDAIQARPGEEVVLLAHASGSQIYTCRPGTGWTLIAPEAELKDQQDNVIGSHFAGPTWKLKDGSGVKGKVSAHVDSEDPDSIPWLLVDAEGHSGVGLLAKVTTIQRVHTHGGKPPAQGCDESHHDTEIKIPYTADYYFYAPAK